MGIAVAVLCVLAPFAAEARTDEAPAIADVEQAYADVDFERAQALASDALRAGYHPPAETRRLYVLLGISASALGRDDLARRAFIRALLSDPTLKLDQSLSPKLRAPYLEARGQWASATAERGLSARLEHDGDTSVVELFDPMGVVHSVEFSYERAGTLARATERRARRGELRLSTGPIAAYEVRLLDEYGNALWAKRGEPPPRAIAASTSGQPRAEPPSRAPYYAVAAAFGATGLAAVAGGVVFQLERERLAREWNGAGCEVPGSTRAEQCAAVDEDRERAELYAVGLYAVGGALLVGGVVTLAVMPGAPDARAARSSAVRCDPTLGVFGMACRGSF